MQLHFEQDRTGQENTRDFVPLFKHLAKFRSVDPVNFERELMLAWSTSFNCITQVCRDVCL